MNCILDASAVINLCNGGVFFTVLRHAGFQWYVGPLVAGECSGRLRPGCANAQIELERAIDATLVTLLGDENIPASRFGELLERHRLGPGETECILFAETESLDICTDDGRARKIISTLIGDSRLIGSIGLLTRAARESLLSGKDADIAYATMLSCGAFLPRLSANHFASGLS